MVAATIVAVACQDVLAVSNPNNPNIAQVLATGADIEAVFAQGFLQVGFSASGIHTNNLAPQLNAMSLENYGNVANFDMVYRAAIPRSFIDNSVNNSGNGVHYADFQNMQKLARTMCDAIAALDKFTGSGKTLGSPAQDARSRAWGFLDLGLSLGNVALFYDSASVAYPTTPTVGPPPPLLSHVDVMTAALGDLDSALAIATAAGNSTAFTAPWINGLNVDQPTFLKIVHSYKARFRAGVARTPAERAAVDWDKVIADATAGITSDVVVSLSIQAGWQQREVTNAYRYAGWGETSMLYLGMADSSGAYDAWLATPMVNRQAFLVKTQDARWPAGDDRPTQNTVSGGSQGLPTNGLYFRNRPAGEDPPGDPWGASFYDHFRFRYLTVGATSADNAGPWIEFPKAENDLLWAEGLIRKGQIAAAAALIDASRVSKGKLPPLTGAVATATDPVPGGASCVPRVPTGPSGPTACGNIMEALKYEYRVETYLSGYGQWFQAMRGWGDLVEGTPLEFPVPYQEMQVRLLPFYNLGGVGGKSAAAKGTYGL
jgi:hypothetical protein